MMCSLDASCQERQPSDAEELMTLSTRRLVMSLMLVVSAVGCQQPVPPPPVGTLVPSVYAKCREVGANREVVCAPSLEELIHST
jgi:hypothetical protein